MKRGFAALVLCGGMFCYSGSQACAQCNQGGGRQGGTSQGGTSQFANVPVGQFPGQFGNLGQQAFAMQQPSFLRSQSAGSSLQRALQQRAMAIALQAEARDAARLRRMALAAARQQLQAQRRQQEAADTQPAVLAQK